MFCHWIYSAAVFPVCIRAVRRWMKDDGSCEEALVSHKSSFISLSHVLTSTVLHSSSSGSRPQKDKEPNMIQLTMGKDPASQGTSRVIWGQLRVQTTRQVSDDEADLRTSQ